MITLLHSLSVFTCVSNQIHILRPIKYGGIFVAGGDHDLQYQRKRHSIKHIHEINNKRFKEGVPLYNIVIIEVSIFGSLYCRSNYPLEHVYIDPIP